MYHGKVVRIQLEVPHELVLNRGFGEVMHEAILRIDGTVVINYERHGPAVESGDRIGVWEVIDHEKGF